MVGNKKKMPRKRRDLGSALENSSPTVDTDTVAFLTSVASTVQGSTLLGTQSIWSLHGIHGMQGVRKAAPALRVKLTQSHGNTVEKVIPPAIRADLKWWVRSMHCIFAPSPINSQVKFYFYNALTSKRKIGIDKMSSNGDGQSGWMDGWNLTC